MIKAAVVGAGGMGSVHLNAYKKIDGVQLIAVCDIRPEQTKEFGVYFGAKEYTSFDQMLEQEKPDILDICTPSYLHKEMAVKAMNLGINVITEKPIALSEQDAEEMFDCAKKNGVHFMVAHVIRFWPEYQALKKACDTRQYGKLIDARFVRNSQFPGWSWENWMQNPDLSGCVPYDLHIHDLDFIVSMLGLPKEAVIRRTGNRLQHHPDHVFANYRYDGIEIMAEASWLDCPYPFTAGYTAHFEQAVMEYKDGVLTVYQDGKEAKTVQMEAGTDETGINLPATDAYFNELDYFARVVAENKTVDCMTREELCGVLHLLDTVFEK